MGFMMFHSSRRLAYGGDTTLRNATKSRAVRRRNETVL